MTRRIGFACKFVDNTGQTVPEYNFKTTTVAWLNSQSKSAAADRLWSLMQYNIGALSAVIHRVGTLDPEQRMMRIGSDMLPVYTEPNWSWFWKQDDVRNYVSANLAHIGTSARNLDIRLSFHPGQFTVLASDSPDVVDRSIEEFEYHADMARWMGYGTDWHDHGFKINVHIAGRAGTKGIIDVLDRLSPEARNLISIENCEVTHGLDACLRLRKHVALVLDIHHHFIKTGEYIQSTDDRVKKIVDSWRGVRPTMHYSLSREDLLVEHSAVDLPDLKVLLESGHKKAKLRAHSDMMWNTAANDWALSFIDQFDIMVEAKNKNLASQQLYEQWKKSIPSV